MSPRYLAATVTFIAMVVAQTAHANEAQEREAFQRYREGNAAFTAGNIQEAHFKYLQSFSLKKSPIVLFNIAATEQKLGQIVESINRYRQVVYWPADGALTDDFRTRAKDRVMELAPKVAQVKIIAPESSRLAVDGKFIDDHPRQEPYALSGGAHTIAAYQTSGIRELQVTVEAGSTKPVDLTPPVPAAPAPSSAPAKGFNPPNISSTTQQVDSRPAPRSTAQIVTSASLLGASVLSLGGGILFLTQGNSKVDEVASIRRTLNPSSCFKSSNASCTSFTEARDAQDSSATLSRLFFVGAGVFALGAAATWFLWPSSANPVVVTPHVTPAGAGVSTLIRF
jgi:hypothetical protein